MMAYRAAGITIPRTSQQQWAYGPRIHASRARPGDLIFFAGSDGTMTCGCRKPVPPVQTRPLDAGDSVPCPARGWQVLASPDVR